MSQPADALQLANSLRTYSDRKHDLTPSCCMRVASLWSCLCQLSCRQNNFESVLACVLRPCAAAHELLQRLRPCHCSAVADLPSCHVPAQVLKPSAAICWRITTLSQGLANKLAARAAATYLPSLSYCHLVAAGAGPRLCRHVRWDGVLLLPYELSAEAETLPWPCNCRMSPDVMPAHHLTSCAAACWRRITLRQWRQAYWHPPMLPSSCRQTPSIPAAATLQENNFKANKVQADTIHPCSSHDAGEQLQGHQVQADTIHPCCCLAAGEQLQGGAGVHPGPDE